MEPIQTEYDGYRFRSRLEARWAVFFDALNVEYEYEPEGFDLGEGLYYLPDFRVKCYGYRGDKDGNPNDLYIEVKGEMRDEDAEKIRRFSGLYSEHFYKGDFDPKDIHPILIVGNIPLRPYDDRSMKPYEDFGKLRDVYFFNYRSIDGDVFMAYPAADEKGHFYLWGDDSHYINFEDEERVENAYMAARQARFEHGETPLAKRQEIDSEPYWGMPIKLRCRLLGLDVPNDICDANAESYLEELESLLEKKYGARIGD